MADKPDKKPDAATPAPAAADGHDKKPAKGGGLLGKTPVLMAGVMLIEAVVLFAGMKFLGGGAKDAAAAETAAIADGQGDKAGADPKAGDKKKTAELAVLESRFPNKVTGRTLLFDVSMFVRVKADHEEKARQKITENKALISDRVRTIIAQSDPEKLSGGAEPGLETLRRQVKYQLDDVLGEGMIEEVLVPRCIPFRADF